MRSFGNVNPQGRFRDGWGGLFADLLKQKQPYRTCHREVRLCSRRNRIETYDT